MVSNTLWSECAVISASATTSASDTSEPSFFLRYAAMRS